MRPGEGGGSVTPALGKGVVAKAAGQSGSWATGPWGDPDVVSFQLVASQSGRRRLGRPQGGTKEPPGIQGSAIWEGETGPSAPQAAGFGQQNRLQGGPSEHQHTGSPRPPALLWEQASSANGWVLGALRKRWVSKPLHRASPWEFVRRGRNEARKRWSVPTGRWGVHPHLLPSPV